MHDVIFLADAQDLWLFNYFFFSAKKTGIEIKVIYFPSRKWTCPTIALDHLHAYGIPKENLISYEGVDSSSFKQHAGGCRWFITKDFLPQGLGKEILRKMIVVSWVGESARRESHNERHGIVVPGYKRLYVENAISPLYDHLGHFSHSPSPKYQFLSWRPREHLCRALGLDPSKKYVTVFTNPNFNCEPESSTGLLPFDSRVKEIFDHIIGWCKKNDIKIILKNKAKHANSYRDQLYHDKFVQGNPSWFHNGLMLMTLSEFSVGLATSAAVEAEELGTRFISFWQHPYQPIDDTLYEDILIPQRGQGYRLAQGKDTFRINPGDALDDIMDSLDLFMKNSKRIEAPHFELDPFLKENFGKM